jgi:hypothetical protein
MPKKKDITVHELLTRKFKNSDEFSTFIKNSAERKKITIMEELLEYCEMNQIDPSICGSLINAELMSLLTEEARKMNLLKG